PAIAKFGDTANFETLDVAKGILLDKPFAFTTSEKSISHLEWHLNEWVGINELSFTEVQQSLTDIIQLAINLADLIALLQAK
ncbi:hypothetical protein, partial [Listeria monocytogenes]|uniref:hypothetical protein n=1 Tax=Listeria monocytogenes TaxID=1639 RepID=UPI000D80D652